MSIFVKDDKDIIGYEYIIHIWIKTVLGPKSPSIDKNCPQKRK